MLLLVSPCWLTGPLGSFKVTFHFRRNPDHFKQFSHPGDSDEEEEEGEGEAQSGEEKDAGAKGR